MDNLLRIFCFEGSRGMVQNLKENMGSRECIFKNERHYSMLVYLGERVTRGEIDDAESEKRQLLEQCF